MERNINGYPNAVGRATGNDDGTACAPDMGATLGDRPRGYAYVPIQSFRMLYPVDKALVSGTLFEELDKPMEVYGNE